MLAVTDNQEVKNVSKPKESDNEDSDDDISDPVDIMPKHFDKEDAFFPNISRSNSAASIDSELRPESACTDASDTSINASFDSSPVPSQSTEIDESNFDVATLTCKLCKKVLKNLRTFRNHKARHLGTLNHKCPDCGKCFEGRSAVNRHLITNHSRELQPHEITNNPSATNSVNIIKPSAPEIKLFKPSEMKQKSTEAPLPVLSSSAPVLDPQESEKPVTSLSASQSSDTAPVLEKQGSFQELNKSLNQMPILLENPENEVRYIVGSQLKASEAAPPNLTENKTDEIKDPDPEDFTEPLSTSSPRRCSSPRRSSASLDNEKSETEEISQNESKEETDDSVNASKLPQKLANFERIIPESDDSDSDKSDSDTSSSSSGDVSSDSDSDDDFSDEKLSQDTKKKPEEITIEDDEEEAKVSLNKSDSNQYHSAFESFLNKSKEESDSDVEEDPLEKKRKTRQTSKRISSSPEKKSKVITMDPAEDDITVFEPQVEKRIENEKKEKQAKDISKQNVSLSDEEEELSLEDEDKDVSKPEKSQPIEKDEQSKPQPKKVSMVAAIFRAKKKQQAPVVEENEAPKLKSKATRVLLPKGSKRVEKGDNSVSESEGEEKEKTEGNPSEATLDKEAQDEADKLLEQKGVAVVGGKLMIPADRLKIPEELCLIKTNGKGKGSKKTFICRICDKQFNRADKMKYHLFNEHYDDFIRCSDSVPKILAKNYAKTETKSSPKASPIYEKTSVSKPSALARIFAMKNKKDKKVEPPKTNIIEDETKPLDVSDQSISYEKKQSPEKSKTDEEDFSMSDDDDVDNDESFKSKSIKSPRIASDSSFEMEEKDINKKETVKAHPIRRSGRSPRSSRTEESFMDLAKEKALIAPPSIMLPNISLKSNVLPFSKTTIFGQEPFSNKTDTIEIRNPFGSQQTSHLAREESSITASFEPKFGSDKNMITFADLAMKSKEQKHDPIIKPEKKRGRPKKVGRKKVSARISVEQSNIEDTPTLLALQAEKEKEELEKKLQEERERKLEEEKLKLEAEKTKKLEEEKAKKLADEKAKKLADDKAKKLAEEKAKKLAEEKAKKLADEKEKAKKLADEKAKKLADEKAKKLADEKTRKLTEEKVNLIGEDNSVKLVEEEAKKSVEPVDKDVNSKIETISEENKENADLASCDDEKKTGDEARPTRSRVHVDAIGIPSSTLDMELHALRNLVFKEILDAKPEDVSVGDYDISEEDDSKECEAKTVEVVKAELPSVKHEESESEDNEELSPRERFIQLGEKIVASSAKFASAIWHERKRLRLQKRKEYNALLEKVSVEKRAKYKPKRHDFSLKLLCSNNLYNNILVESDRTLKELEGIHYLVKNCSKLVKNKTKLYSLKKTNGLKTSLKRLQHHKYSCTPTENLKIFLYKIPEISEDEDDIDNENNTNQYPLSFEAKDISDEVVIKASDLRKTKTLKKDPSPKRLKVKGEVTTKTTSEPKVLKKRGRKPKALVEASEKPKLKRGRKPKPKPILTEQSSSTDQKSSDQNLPVDLAKSEFAEETSFKAKRPRKGRPRKLTNEDVVKCKQLDIQVVNEDKTPTEGKKADDQNNEKPSFSIDKVLGLQKDKTQVFDFQDVEESKDRQLFSSKQNQNKEVGQKDLINDSSSLLKDEEYTTPLKKKKIKRCEILDGSGDEHQVPLKITFKRQCKDGDASGKLRKSIKLRVKTQTTRDNGLKIQIKQPKTDNPLKFKVKAGSKDNKRRKIRVKNLSSAVKESCESHHLDSADKSDICEAQQSRESIPTSAGKYSFTPFTLH